MNATTIKNRIKSLCTHITFAYDGMSCGVDPFSEDNFEMWCGDSVMTAGSIDEVMQAPFFNGKALQDIADEITDLEL